MGLIPAAVLVPLVPSGSGHQVLFTKRTEEVETHKGQISFPGGLLEEADAGPADAALREMEEELGVQRSRVEVLGFLESMWTPTGYRITPVVGLLEAGISLRPNPREVALAFAVSLESLLSLRPRSEVRMIRGRAHRVLFYDTPGHTIWGATAGILSALLERSRPGYSSPQASAGTASP